MDQIISNFRLSEVLLLLSLLLHATMRSVTLALFVLLAGFSACLSQNNWLLMDCGGEGDGHKPMEIHVQSVSRPTGAGGNATIMVDAYKMYLICGNGTAGRKRDPLFVEAPGRRHPVSVGYRRRPLR